MDINHLIEQAFRYKIYSECFYFPTESQVEVINELIRESEQYFTDIPMIDSSSIEAMQIDFSRLFVGPFELLSPPYGSVYMEDGRKTFGDSSVDVMKFYQSEGLKVQVDEVPDHIAIELEFIYFLMTKEISALQSGDEEAYYKYNNKRTAFQNRHLSKWIDDFSASVQTHAKTRFYADIAEKLSADVLIPTFEDLQ